jgi:hypothetical protein
MHDNTPLDAKMVVWHVMLIIQCNINGSVNYKIIIQCKMCLLQHGISCLKTI